MKIHHNQGDTCHYYYLVVIPLFWFQDLRSALEFFFQTWIWTGDRLRELFVPIYLIRIHQAWALVTHRQQGQYASGQILSKLGSKPGRQQAWETGADMSQPLQSPDNKSIPWNNKCFGSKSILFHHLECPTLLLVYNTHSTRPSTCLPHPPLCPTTPGPSTCSLGLPDLPSPIPLAAPPPGRVLQRAGRSVTWAGTATLPRRRAPLWTRPYLCGLAPRAVG